MLADELGMSSINQEQLATFKRALEHEHNIKIRLVSGGTVVRGNVTYVRRGALAFSRLFHNYSACVHQSWAEVDERVEDANNRACHVAVERLGDVLNKEDNLAW